MNLLKDKIAIVTASSRGIGLEITHKLVAEGATVYMAVRDSETNRNLTTKLNKENNNYQAVFYDAFDFDSYQKAVSDVIFKAGRIDLLVNNFGWTNTSEDKTLTTGNPEAVKKIINVNIMGTYYMSRYVVQQMLKQDKGGNIVNVSSVAGNTPDISRLAYGISKAAINSLTQQTAVEYARKHIRVNAVLPGLVATDGALDNMPEEFRKVFIKNVPLNSIVKPEDIANVVAFLLSDQAKFITGELIPVAGGFGLPTPIYGDLIQ